MYILSSFVEIDLGNLHEFIENHSFAVLVTHDGAEATASDLPILLDREAGKQGKRMAQTLREDS